MPMDYDSCSFHCIICFCSHSLDLFLCFLFSITIIDFVALPCVWTTGLDHSLDLIASVHLHWLFDPLPDSGLWILAREKWAVAKGIF